MLYLLLGKEQNAFETMDDLVHKFLGKYKTLAQAGKLSQSTYKGYCSSFKVCRDFFAANGIRHPAHIKPAMQEDFYLFCLARGISHNTTINKIHLLRMFLIYCVEHEYIHHTPFPRLKYRMEKRDVEYLEADEVKAIREAAFERKVLQESRDCFLFSCLTGISYGDLAHISKDNIIQKERAYLHLTRQKTKIAGTIPLLREAGEILEKYDYALPVQEYRTYLYHLKSIFKEAGLDHHKARTHMGRKTFADSMLNRENVPLEVVSAMLCHAQTTTTAKHYAHVRFEKIKQCTAHLI